MKYKVSELEGARLAAAVAKAEGLEWRFCSGMDVLPVDAEDGESVAAWVDGILPFYELDWPTMGPIIDRQRIDLRWDGQCWEADCWRTFVHEEGGTRYQGSSPLIAAMRAYAASRFGDEVELP